MNKPAKRLGEGHPGQIIARLTQSDTANANFSDEELSSRKRIQIHAFGHKVSPRVKGRKWQTGFARKGVNLLLLNESNLVVRLLRMRRECADAAEVTELPSVTVPVQADAVAAVNRLTEALEDHDDVKEVYSNAEL